jgi:hypothetical protein
MEDLELERVCPIIVMAAQKFARKKIVKQSFL